MQDGALKALWLSELDQMRTRVAHVRQQIVETERTLLGSNRLAYIGKQSGMFSLLPLTDAQETALTRDHGIHVVKGGRVNVARLGVDDITKLIVAISDVTSAK